MRATRCWSRDEHLETIWDLPDDLVAQLFANARLLSAAVRSAMKAQGAFVAINNVVSQSVPHLHVHVVPRNRKDGLRGFFWPRTKYESERQMRDTASAVRAAVSELAIVTAVAGHVADVVGDQAEAVQGAIERRLAVGAGAEASRRPGPSPAGR